MVNMTDSYVSFKIERYKYVGKVKGAGGHHAVENETDDVNYFLLEDIHETEQEAYNALISILQYKNDNLTDK